MDGRGVVGLETQAVSMARLTRRLADTPRDFLAEPDQVSVAAVVSDVLRLGGGDGLGSAGTAPFLWLAKDRNRLRLVLITCWLVADEELVAVGRAERLHVLLTSGVSRLAALVDADKFVSDPDRREELARITVRALGLPVAGETTALTDAERWPLLTEEGAALLRRLREHRHAPHYNHACGDRLTAEARDRLRAAGRRRC